MSARVHSLCRFIKYKRCVRQFRLLGDNFITVDLSVPHYVYLQKFVVL
jgi:hypothetical protein